MRWSTLGRSAVEITELSFGAAGIGNLYTAVEPAAGRRRGRRRLGRGHPHLRHRTALRPRPLRTPAGRGPAHPAPRRVHPLHQGRTAARTLPGRRGDDLANGFAVPADHRRVWDFSADGVRRSIEESLDRLGLDRIDIVYLHDPDDHAEAGLPRRLPGPGAAARRRRRRRDRRRHEPGRDAHPLPPRHRRRRRPVRRPLHPARPERARRAAARGRRPRQERRRRRGLQLRTARRPAPRRHVRLRGRARRHPASGPCASRRSPNGTAYRCAPPPCAIPLGPSGRRGRPGRRPLRRRSARRGGACSPSTSRPRSGTNCAPKDCCRRTGTAR